MWCVGFATCHTDAAPASEGHVSQPMAGNLGSAGDVHLRKFASTLVLNMLTTFVEAEIIGSKKGILFTTRTA